MKTRLLISIILFSTLLFYSKDNYGQAPDLGIAANFVLFTANGAVGNTGISRIKGDIGTNSGIVSNFETSVIDGTIHTSDAITVQCASDLLAAYSQLSLSSPDSIHLPELGNGETLRAGVYSVLSAASVSLMLNLDAAGDSNAIFIFKIGGAFTTGASATVNLLNSAAAKNVFWIAEGEIAMAALTSMKGTLIAHNGAISLGAGGILEGRMFSTAGAIATDHVLAAIELPYPVSNVLMAPNLGTAANFVLFTIAGAVGNTGISQLTGDIGTNDGAITGFGTSTVNGTIHLADAVTAQCAIDLQAAYDQLILSTPTSIHGPVLGNNEILFPGMYDLAAAGSLVSTLTLDAQGDPNAIFIFKTGGAFTTAASSSVSLVNGAAACNVFWLAEGAIAMAASTSMKGTMISHNGAISMGAGGILEGRMFSTTGAASVYEVSASIPVGCSLNNTWTGAAGTSDWFTDSNWTRGVPDGVMGTIIPTTLITGRLFPVINTGVASVDTIIIQTSASLTITNSILRIKGIILNSGTVNAAHGSVEMTGAFSQLIHANTFENNALYNLIISNYSDAGVALEGALDLYGSLTYPGTGMKLMTNDALTLKATALHTATIGIMTGNMISGKVTVEIYIPARKAWRFLSIATNSLQTIKEAWQEGATGTNSNPENGFGTQITSERPSWLAEGFDLLSVNGPSMKTFVSNSWYGVTNTNVQDIRTARGYMTFIRGDRSANTFNAFPTETILRTKGALNTGDQPVIPAIAGQFTSFGNPYPSVLDMRNINKTGLKDFFYLWDPKLAGTFGYGAYQTFTFDGSNYIVIPGMGSYGPAGSVSNYIESGQAFLMQADSMGGNLNFNEDAKVNPNSRLSTVASAIGQQLMVNLYGSNTAVTDYMADGLLVHYDNNSSNNIDGLDAIKAINSAENLSIKKGNSLLVIEVRHSFETSDTILLNLTNTKVQRYRFELNTAGWALTGLTCILEDAYLHTTTPISD